MSRFRLLAIASTTLIILLCVSTGQAQEWFSIFEVGDDIDWNVADPVRPGVAQFVQEANVNDPPGDPNSPAVNQQADDDYYTAGTYPDPIGTVGEELVVERAFAGADNNLRFHFNLPDSLDDLEFRFSTTPFNLHIDAATVPDPRYGVQVLFNGTIIQPEVVVRPDDLDAIITSTVFTAADVNALPGAADNVINVQGVNYSAEGGGSWMGLDYHHLEARVVPEPGALSMMLCGMLWLLPLLSWEKQRGYF